VKSRIYDNNISVLNYFKYRKDSISSEILKYTEGYSQAYEFYLDNKSTEELKKLLSRHNGESGGIEIYPKAYVISKVLYFRTGNGIYLEKLRYYYAIHNQLMKEISPEYYEYNLLDEPLEDYPFE